MVVSDDHEMQTGVVSVSDKAVLDNSQATGPDYDEIKDDPHTKESSEKLLLEEKSVEESHNYHTLIPGEEQESNSKVVYYFCECMWFTINFPLLKHVCSQ